MKTSQFIQTAGKHILIFLSTSPTELSPDYIRFYTLGLILVKYMGLEKGMNITLGLPFVRTSPDHGTVFDIAGHGLDDIASHKTALKYENGLVTSQYKEST